MPANTKRKKVNEFSNYTHDTKDDFEWMKHESSHENITYFVVERVLGGV